MQKGGLPSLGSLTRPAHFQTSDGWSFSNIHGGNQTEPLVASECKNGALSITFQNPTNASD
jgi:hypothetical protein